MVAAARLVWLLVAWVLPAFIAGALGWEGVWGNRNGWVDYLTPLPIAGGFLHVITLGGTVGILLAARALPDTLRRLLPALFIAAALCGVVLMLDVQTLYLQATTDLGARSARSLGLDANPLGLFLITDGLLAALYSLSDPLCRPRGGGAIVGSLVLLAALPLLTARTLVAGSSVSRSDFLPGGGVPGLSHGDDAHVIYTRLAPTDPAFRAAAERVAAQYDPSRSLFEDQAIYFTTSLDAARSGRAETAFATYCMYEDGTAPQWLAGFDDCFGPHDSFSNVLERESRRLVDESMPQEVATFLGVLEACRVTARPPPSEGYVEVAALRQCGDPAARLEALLQGYGSDPRVRRRLEAAAGR